MVGGIPLIRVVDDDESFLKSQQILLETLGWQVRTWSSAAAFLEEEDFRRAGCLILDIRMPGMGGLELQKAIAARGVSIPIIFLTGHGSIDLAVHTMRYGAEDFLEKPVDPGRLRDAVVRAVAKCVESRSEELDRRRQREGYESLSPREKEVVALAARAEPNKVIARELGISVTTVKMHRANAFAKLGINSAAEAARVLMGIGVLVDEKA